MKLKLPKLLSTVRQSLKNHRKLWRIGVPIVAVVLCIAAASLYLLFRNSANTKKLDDSQNQYHAVPAELLKGLEKKTEGVCKGGYKIAAIENPTEGVSDLCTHGPDMALSISNDSPMVTGDLTVPCYGDGNSGQRVEVIYAVASDVPNRYGTVTDIIQKSMANADRQINASGQKTGSMLHVKWLTDTRDGNCFVKIAQVTMPPDGDDNFGKTIEAVKKAGYTRTDRKYLLMTDARMYCGIATFYYHDIADPARNYNNIFPSYSRIDTGCWGKTRSTEAHELMHNLGAVQITAPNATTFAHCTDIYDPMCYVDTPTTVLKMTCSDVGASYLFDCNNDDYLHSNPVPGSYLATHWNVFNSSYLYHQPAADTKAPTTPTELVEGVNGLSVTLHWNASTDDVSKTMTYRIYRRLSGGVSDYYDSTQATSYVDKKVEAGKTYQYYVVAVDEVGNASNSSNVVTAKVATASTSPSIGTIAISAGNISQNGFDLSWLAPTNASLISKIEVLINGSVHGTTVSGATSYKVCCSLASATSYTVQLRAYSTGGSAILSNRITTVTLAAPRDPLQAMRPYNLQITSANGSEIIISAKIDSTISPAYVYVLAQTGRSYGMDTYFPPSDQPKTYTFRDVQMKPQDVTGYYIIVKDRNGTELTRSGTIPYTYSGLPETNPPAAPSNFTVTSYKVVTWDHSYDDSGRVYIYRTRVIDSAGVTRSNSASYSNSASFSYASSGETLTLYVKAEDMWGNVSPESSFTFTVP